MRQTLKTIIGIRISEQFKKTLQQKITGVDYPLKVRNYENDVDKKLQKLQNGFCRKFLGL